MHVVDTEWVEIVAYQLNNVARTLSDQWKKGRVKDASSPSWACFEEALL